MTILILLGKGFPSGKDSNVFLPIIIILPVVILRNRFKSDEIFAKSCPLFPIPQFSSTDTIKSIFSPLYYIATGILPTDFPYSYCSTIKSSTLKS